MIRTAEEWVINKNIKINNNNIRCCEVVRSDDKKSIYKRRSMKNNEDTNSCSKDETFFVTGYEGK